MKKLNLYLQLFAENNEETPTEEVETNEELQKEETEEVDFEDSENVDDQEDNKENKEQEEKPKKSTKNTKTENMLNAQRRLEEKQRRKEQEIASQTKIDTVKKISGGKNKFTGEPIIDEYDVAEYEIMLEIEASGKDVLEEYPKIIKERQRQERLKIQKEQEEKEANDKRIQDDIASFNEKYGSDIANQILHDDEFIEFADDLLGLVPLTTIYERYQNQKSLIEKKAEDKLLKKEARKRSSPGVPGNKQTKNFSFSDMTDEEFHEFVLSMSKKY